MFILSLHDETPSFTKTGNKALFKYLYNKTLYLPIKL